MENRFCVKKSSEGFPANTKNISLWGEYIFF